VANPLVAQGTLNKLRGAGLFIANPQLNFSASYLGEEGITLAFEGDASAYLPTMTGAVPSPNPYMMANVTARLLKTQALAAVYKTQFEFSTTIGDMSIVSDASTLPDYYLSNCTLLNVTDLSFNGSTANFTVNIRGTYYVNSTLFNAA
jgi:hypothetical protein